MIITEFLGHFDDIPADTRNDLGSAVTLVCKHQGKQLRDSGEPYLEHIFDVTYQLVQIGCDKDTVIGSCLHDIVEDTAIDLDFLATTFNQRVAFIVGAGSKRPKGCFPDKAARLEEFHHRFIECAKEDSAVIWPKLADRLHNLATLYGLYHDPTKQQRIAHETLEFYIPFLSDIAPGLVPKKMQKHLVIYCHKLYHLAMAYCEPPNDQAP